MKDKRQGNDLKVAWSIFKKDGEPFRLEGLDVSLYLKNMFGRKELNDFVVTGNIIQWTFYGKDQKNSGKYSLEMVINEGEKGMITTDKCDFVNLVACSCKLQGGEDAPNVETESIELASTLEYVAGGGDYDDTALWKELENKVDKEKGKGLSSNDYTNEDKEKLDGLKNYDDSGIKEELAKKVESEVVVDTESTEDFEFGYDDTKIRQEIAELSAEVGKKQDTITDLATIRSGAEKGATAIQEVKTINGQSIVGSGNIAIQGGGGGGDDTMTRILAGATPFICYKKTDGTIGFWDGYFVGTNHRQQTDIVEILFGGFGATPNASQFLNGWTNLEKIYPYMNGSGCTDLSFAFQNDAKLKDLSMLKDWDVSKVAAANACFSGCAPDILPIGDWNISSLTHMSNMFQNYSGCSVDFSKWTNDKVTLLNNIFYGSSFERLDLKNIRTANCTTFSGAFREASTLKWLDIRGWSCVEAQAVGAMHAMFNGCTQLTTLVGDTSVDAVIADNIKVFEGYTATSNLSIKESSVPLNRASLRALINGLADMSETGATLPIGSANIAKLTNDDIAVATAKGWTLS